MAHDRVALALALLGALASCLLVSTRRKRHLSLPPSPKGYPLIGHLFQMPSSDEAIFYRDVGLQLKSDIISFTVLGQVIVVLNSVEVAKDLLVKRGAVYSDRAELPMLTDADLVGWGNNTGFLRYGARWKKQRYLTQVALHPDAGEDIWPKMVKNVRRSMQRLLHRPEGISRELQWMTASIILSAVYGYEPAYPVDELVELVETSVLHLCEAAMPTKFLVNTIPWLRNVPSWLPGAGWKRTAKIWRAEKERTIEEPYEWTKAQIAAGVASSSILKNLLTKFPMDEASKNQDHAEQEDIIRWAAGTLYIGSYIWTVASMNTFILAMVLYPQVQKKIQDELDSVLGENRLPERSDRKNLPYLDATLKEVMRWRPVLPVGVPRTCTHDDEYRGYIIPKGAIVMVMHRAMSNDPSTYPEPGDFRPERFVGTSVPAAPAFGFGRRECPGINFAESSLFLMASTFLTIFNVAPTPGKPVPEANTHSNRLVSHPAPFDCTVTPRSEARRRLINSWVEI
ncbi:cytochrome P450 family protein [Ceratobasidium sp. AG-Ba]|nr:cytochrome P450 family protein [Ceratobasidium sp. AG-Ba]